MAVLQKPLIVEFFGRPGAGKTTLTHGLVARLMKELGIQAGMSRVGYWYIHRFVRDKKLRLFLNKYLTEVRFRHHPYLAEGVLSQYLDELRNQENDQEKVSTRSRLLIRDLVHYLMVGRSSAGYVSVLDEGLAQRGISGELSGISTDTLKSHFRLMPLAHIFVHVRVENQSIKRRLIKRDGTDAKYVREESLNNVLYELKKRDGVILEVDGSHQLDESVTDILSFVSSTYLDISSEPRK